MAVILNTPVGRISYPSLFKPRPPSNGQGEAKYQAVIILKPADCGPIIEAIKKAAMEKWHDKALDGLKHKRLHNPLRDGSEKEDEAYQGMYFISASSKNKPGLVDRDGNPVTNEEAVYPGMYVRLNIAFFDFTRPEKKGIGVGLNHVQLVAPGPRLDNRTTPDKAFADDAKFDGYDPLDLGGEANPFD